MGAILDLKSSPDDVWAFLSDEAKVGLKVVSTDKATGRIKFRTKVGFFSWGEEITVAITPYEGGSRLLFDGAALVGLNLTADVDGKIRQLAELIQGKLP